MPLMTCPKCERFHYVPGECLAPKFPAPDKRQLEGETSTDPKPVGQAVSPAKPKDTRKADRHPPGYQAAKQKLYRERKKAKT